MIPDAMYARARALIEKDTFAAFKQANPKPLSSKTKCKSYMIPQRCVDLIAALNKGDAEHVAAIMLYQFYY